MEEEDGDNDTESITKFRFVPRAQSALQAVFTAGVDARPGIPPEDGHNGEHGEAPNWDRGYALILYHEERRSCVTAHAEPHWIEEKESFLCLGAVEHHQAGVGTDPP